MIYKYIFRDGLLIQRLNIIELLLLARSEPHEHHRPGQVDAVGHEEDQAPVVGPTGGEVRVRVSVRVRVGRSRPQLLDPLSHTV